MRSTRSPSSGCGASSTRAAARGHRTVLLRRAGRPRRHRGGPQRRLHRRHPLLVGAGADRPGPGGPRQHRADLVQGRRGRHLRRAGAPSSTAPPTRRCGRRSASSRPPSTRPTWRASPPTSTEAQDVVQRRGAPRPPRPRPRARRRRHEPARRHHRGPSRARHPRPGPPARAAGSSAPRAPTTSRWRCSTSAAPLTFLVLALTQWALMRVQLIVPDSTLIVPEIFARLLSAVGRHVRRPLLRADRARRRDLHRAAADRRARRRLPAPEPALRLALHRRRRGPLHELRLHARRGRGAGPAAALGHGLQPGPRHGQLDHGRRPRHGRASCSSR